MDNLVKAFRKWREKRKTIFENKELCRRYPFLTPWNRFTGDMIRPYDWSYTELDMMPDGWRKRFGLNMCQELRTALIGDDDLYSWRIVQMKEKYGELRVCDNGTVRGSQVPNILNKYEFISRYVCINCGADATRVTLGWISPYCDKCCPDHEEWLPVGEYYKEENDIE